MAMSRYSFGGSFDSMPKLLPENPGGSEYSTDVSGFWRDRKQEDHRTQNPKLLALAKHSDVEPDTMPVDRFTTHWR